jgi:hypothetical protein
LQIHVRDGRVRLFTMNGADWSKRYPLGGLGHNAPVSVEWRSNCGRFRNHLFYYTPLERWHARLSLAASVSLMSHGFINLKLAYSFGGN